MQKLTTDTRKIMITNKKLLYLKYWDRVNLYGWAMSQKFLVGGFKWVEDTFQFNKDFIMNYNEDIDIGYFLGADVQCSEKLYKLHNDLPFIPERMKIRKIHKMDG